MLKRIRWLASGVAIALSTLAMPGHATVVDFQDPNIVGAYFDGESFAQNGFLFTQLGDPGTVDVGTSLPPGSAPTNNAGQFYYGSNQGALEITSLNGMPFSLDGFDATFVPVAGGPSQQIGVIALGYYADSDLDPVGFYFGLGNTAATTHGYPFLTFAGGSTFAAYTNLVAVDFYSCVISPSVCEIDSRNNSGFALDNIRLTAAVAPIPEPETFALMAAGLLALGVARRRRVR